jgi:Fe(3+) dicitrate transport protein
MRPRTILAARLAPALALAVVLGWAGLARAQRPAGDEPIDVDAGPALPPEPSAAQPPAAPPPPAPPRGRDYTPPLVAPDAPEAEPAEPSQDPIDIFVGGARAKDTTGSAHLITTRQLERFEQDDPHKILQTVPGVYVRGEDGFGLRPNIGMRGAISDRSKKLTLMEDGVLFAPAPYSAPAAYYFPVMTRMTAVRVIKGPSAIAYGPHTVAGAIDLVTAPIPDEPAGMIDASIGQFLSRKLHARLGTSKGPVGIVAEGVHLGAAGFSQLDGNADTNTGFSRNEIMVKARYEIGQVGETFQDLELKTTFSNEFSNQTYLGLTQADFEASPYRRYVSSGLDHMEWNRLSFVLSHHLVRGADLDVTTTAYRHDLHRIWTRFQGLRGASINAVLRDPDDPANQAFLRVLRGDTRRTTDEQTMNVGPNDRDFTSGGLQTVVRWRPKTGPFEHRIEAGTRAHYDSISRVHTQRGYEIDGGELAPIDDLVETTTRNAASSFALAMHAMDAITWKFLTLTGGARLESIRSENDDALTNESVRISQQILLPGGGVFVALPHDFGLLFGVYEGFSPIPPGSGSTTLPEKSVNYEFGGRWSPKRFRAELIGFVNDYSNLANICTFSSGCDESDIDQQFDGGTALVTGLEAYVESEVMVTDELRLPGKLAYTFSHGEFTNDFVSADPTFGEVTAGDTVPYIPTHQLSATLGVESDRWGTYVSGTYTGAMREVAGSGDPEPFDATDSSFVLDAAGRVKVVKNLTAYITARNLLDATYVASHRPFGARPGAPLWIQVGGKVEF